MPHAVSLQKIILLCRSTHTFEIACELRGMKSKNHRVIKELLINRDLGIIAVATCNTRRGRCYVRVRDHRMIESSGTGRIWSSSSAARSRKQPAQTSKEPRSDLSDNMTSLAFSISAWQASHLIEIMLALYHRHGLPKGGYQLGNGT